MSFGTTSKDDPTETLLVVPAVKGGIANVTYM